MESIEAMKKGFKERCFQDTEDEIKKLVTEGIVGHVPYKGTLYEVANQLLGGLRFGMGYCGSANIEALHNAKFVKSTSWGMTESHQYDVAVTREASNYNR